MNKLIKLILQYKEYVKVKYKATKKAKVKLTNKDSLVNHFFL